MVPLTLSALAWTRQWQARRRHHGYGRGRASRPFWAWEHWFCDRPLPQVRFDLLARAVASAMPSASTPSVHGLEQQVAREQPSARLERADDAQQRPQAPRHGAHVLARQGRIGLVAIGPWMTSASIGAAPWRRGTVPRSSPAVASGPISACVRGVDGQPVGEQRIRARMPSSGPGVGGVSTLPSAGLAEPNPPESRRPAGGLAPRCTAGLNVRAVASRRRRSSRRSRRPRKHERDCGAGH